MIEGDKTNWFHKSGIYQLQGPMEAGYSGGANDGKMFMIDKMIQQDDGSLAYEELQITQCVHTKNLVTALKGAVRYFTGPDYEANKIEYFSCSLSETVEGGENAG
jgi:hypothetical protein